MPFRNLLYLLAFLEGAIVMVVELLGARMIAPAYGTSLPVWTVVLSLAVGALAVGYRAGGRMAEKGCRVENLLEWFLTAAAIIAIMPAIATMFMTVLHGIGFWISLTACAVIFIMPPLFMLGATTPVITKLLTTNAVQAGSEAGRVFGISTLGGIAGTFIAGFYLIPLLGLTLTALSAAMLLGVIPIALLLRERRFRHIVLFTAALLLASWFNGKDIPVKDVKVLYRSEGLLGQLLVADIPRDFDPAKGYERVLFVNRTGQTWVDLSSGRSKWEYVDYLAAVSGAVRKKPRVLLLGLGGGTVARELQERYGADVDAVELDGRIAEVAKEYFDLADSTNIIIDDARHFIRITRKSYDLVIFDVFSGEVPPAHALTLEAFRKVKSMLNPGGIIIVNFNGFIDGREGIAGRSICKTLYSAGFEIKVLPTPGEEARRNMLYIAYREKDQIDFGNTAPVKRADGSMWNVKMLFLKDAEIDFSQAEILRDDRPMLELMNIPASLAWRKGYREYTKALDERGVPVFE